MQDGSTIVAKLHGTPNEWVAYFRESPGHAYYSDKPVKAVRRLLEGTEADSGVFVMLCDGETAGGATRRYEVIWDSPVLYFPCAGCEGRGEYLGLLVREVCPGCNGRKVVPV